MSQSPTPSLPPSLPPQPETELSSPHGLSLHNLPPNITWRDVKDVINEVYPCWCMVRMVIPGIANVEVESAQVAEELAKKMNGYDLDGFVVATHPPIPPQQTMMLQHQTMMTQQMQMGLHHPMALPYNQYGAFPHSPQHFGPPQYMPYVPPYMAFYPGTPPMADSYLASVPVQENTHLASSGATAAPETSTSKTASPSATSSSASSVTNSPMPYFVAPMGPPGPDWTQASPMFNMALNPTFVPYGHMPRMRRYGYGGYKQRMMNFSDTPIDKLRLFVGNIPFATTWYELKSHLSSCGPVAHVEIQTNDMGDSLGFALVTFEDEDTAKKAIDMFDGKMFEGRALKVHYDRVPPRKHYNQHRYDYNPNYSRFNGNGNGHGHGNGVHNNIASATTPGSNDTSPAPPAVSGNGYNRYKGFKPFVPSDAGK